MKLLTGKDKSRLPALYATENDKDPMAYVKFFNPRGSQTIFITEYDGEDTLFGYIMGKGIDSELGYFSLNELQRNKFERDTSFVANRLKAARAEQKALHGEKNESVMLREFSDYDDRSWDGFSENTEIVKADRIAWHDDGFMFIFKKSNQLQEDRLMGNIRAILLSEDTTRQVLDDADYMPEEIEDILWRAQECGDRDGIKLDKGAEVEITRYLA